jgi:hypothetical protein
MSLSKSRAATILACGALAVTPAAALAGNNGGGGKGGKPGGKPGCKTKTGGKGCPSGTGRMTGGGSVFGVNAFRTTHGFQIRCGKPDQSNLEVNWNSGNSFHATSFSNLVCDGPPTGTPAADFNRLTGFAEGRYNGAPATAWFQFEDLSEPGTLDTAKITVWDGAGHIVLDVNGTLEKGNHQAHKG